MKKIIEHTDYRDFHDNYLLKRGRTGANLETSKYELTSEFDDGELDTYHLDLSDEEAELIRDYDNQSELVQFFLKILAEPYFGDDLRKIISIKPVQ